MGVGNVGALAPRIAWELGGRVGAKKVAWEPSNCKRGPGMPTALRTAVSHDRRDVVPLSRQLELVRIEPVIGKVSV